MKLLVAILALSMSAFAFADSFAPDESVMTALSVLLGEKSEAVFMWFIVIGYGWAQVRQLIPAKIMSKLPHWLISILEFVAANKLQAENSLYNDPNHHKRIRKDFRGRL